MFFLIAAHRAVPHEAGNGRGFKKNQRKSVESVLISGEILVFWAKAKGLFWLPQAAAEQILHPLANGRDEWSVHLVRGFRMGVLVRVGAFAPEVPRGDPENSPKLNSQHAKRPMHTAEGGCATPDLDDTRADQR